ncbi:MAG TPA: hypothetical protein DDY77_00520 [Clostridiales bacterium]|nr:hypothetical protein [Clostridiales bacterium]
MVKKMIELKNIKKNYISKGGNVVNALKDINLTLPSFGMVFIVGKSGSGKSTLLNVIGGLDEINEGNVYFDGKEINLKNKKTSDLYRKKDIGFVFQEYNLLDNNTVFENIELAAKLCGKTDKDINKAISEVGLSEYSSHFSNELSGGQKQRVAIARAIVKQPKVILADEPTGNLDSSTSDEIFALLKSLSKRRLVLVVTHDIAASEKYADRIITVKDGLIEKDEERTSTKENFQEKQAVENEIYDKDLPFRTIVKQGLKNLGYKKGRTILTVCLLFLSVAVMLWSQMFIATDSQKIMARSLHKNGEDIVFLYQEQYLSEGTPPSGSVSTISAPLSHEGLNYISSVVKPQIGTNITPSLIRKVVEVSKMSDVTSLGFELYDGAIDSEEKNYAYLSDYTIDKYFELFNVSKVNYADYIGKEIVFSTAQTEETVILAGVFKTDYRKYYEWDYEREHFFLKANLTQEQSMKAYYCEDKAEIAFLKKDKLLDLYEKESRGLYIFNVNSFVRTSSGEKVFGAYTVTLESENKSVDLNKPYFLIREEVSKFYSDSGEVENYVLKPGEIILPIKLYRDLFEPDYRSGAIPEFLGKKITVSLSNYGETDKLTKTKELTLKGVAEETHSDSSQYIYINGDDGKNIRSYTLFCNQNFAIANISTLSKGQLTEFFEMLREKYEIATANIMSYSVYDLEDTFKLSSVILQIIAVIMFIVSLLLVINTVFVFVTSKTKEIGIMRAFGISGKSIIEIHLVKVIFIAIVSFVLTNITAVGLIALTGAAFSGPNSLYCSWIAYDGITVLLSILCNMIFPILFSLLPLNKINRMKPVDAIRSV